MNEMKYAMLTEVLGHWKAEIIESFLKAEGIDVVLVQDSVSQSTYFNPFAPVQIFVSREEIQQARALLETFGNSPEEDEEDNEDE
ncbi:MAG TPA: DUF2007 domain-containing protein [Anaerolineales bacterium]|nr:DUF2007 domain-containing protein [Anaerolineales bacterium]